MPFVKLDVRILESSLWDDRVLREVFITALLMARPHEVREELEAIAVDSLDKTGFRVPVGWYGFVEAASAGIVRRAGVPRDDGIQALKELGEPDLLSRTPDHEGRRMVRVPDGFVILNYDKYREKDHTSAERSKRYREKQRAAKASRRDTP